MWVVQWGGYKVTGGHTLKCVPDAEKVEHKNWLKEKKGYATTNDNIPFFYKDQNIIS
jgi:hypothetical protein